MGKRFASDDVAGELLASILDDTAEEAEAEARRIEEALRQKEEARRQVRRVEEEERRKQAEARLQAEKERLQGIEARRTQKLAAIRIEELKERGEWSPVVTSEAPAPAVTPGVTPDVAPEATPDVAPVAETQEMVVMARPSRSRGGLGGMASVVAVAAVVLLWIGAPGGYEIDEVSYAKATYVPSEKSASLVEVGFLPVPERQESPTVRPRPRPRPAPVVIPEETRVPAERPSLELNLDDDPFARDQH